MGEMLMDTDLSAEQRSLVDCVQVSASNLLVILNDILDISKIESGKMQLECMVFNLAQIVQQTGRLFEPHARKKSIAFEISSDIPYNLEMRGDPGRIQQVLSNLISNSIKFTSEGYVRLSVQHEGWQARFIVEDTGIGINDKAKEKLFTPFSQGDSSTARCHGGTGLGLTISRNLAEMMGGSLEIVSEISKGTTTIFTVPLASKTAPCSTPAVEKSGFDFPTISNGVRDHQSRRGSRPEIATQNDKIVLIAEDNPIMQKVTLNSLRKLGYRAEAVWNGQEALDYVVQHQKVGLILMDCQMPLLDGYEATRQVRCNPAYAQFSDLPIIALTASAIKGDWEACKEAGMNEYLTKPLHKQSLKEMLAHWFPN